MLFIQGVTFQEDFSTRETCFYFQKNDDEEMEISLSISFNSNIIILSMEGEEDLEEEVLPSLEISEHITKAQTLQELVGQSFEVGSIEEADEREDLFYLFEHEPFVKYKLDIIAIEENKVNIRCEGIAVTDGYADPYESETFKLECWLPIITESDDWKKFGL